MCDSGKYEWQHETLLSSMSLSPLPLPPPKTISISVSNLILPFIVTATKNDSISHVAIRIPSPTRDLGEKGYPHPHPFQRPLEILYPHLSGLSIDALPPYEEKCRHK